MTTLSDGGQGRAGLEDGILRLASQVKELSGDVFSAELHSAVRAGDEALVERITQLVDIAEYKRRQSPPGVRVSRKAFGKDRRLPITNGYRSL